MSLLDDQRQYYERFFKDQRDEEWNKAPGKDVLIRALSHEYVEKCLNASERLIDLGCGSGFLLNRIHYEVCGSWELVGVDFAALAIEKGKTAYPNLQLFCEDATATHFPGSYFSVVINYGSVEHFPKPTEAIKEVARLLAPRGLFLFMPPSLNLGVC